MKKLLCGAAVMLLCVAGLIAADDKTPDVETIMKKVNGKKSGLQSKVGTGLKAASPSWDDMKKQMTDYCKFADALGKNDPPKGDKKSWEKLCKEYAENAKKLKDAIDKKDKAAAEKAHKAINDSCKACHDSHR